MAVLTCSIPPAASSLQPNHSHADIKQDCKCDCATIALCYSIYFMSQVSESSSSCNINNSLILMLSFKYVTVTMVTAHAQGFVWMLHVTKCKPKNKQISKKCLFFNKENV